MREWSVEALVTRFLKYSACWKVLYHCLYSAKQSVKFQPVALKLLSSVFSKPKIDSPNVAAPKQPKFKRQNSYYAEATSLYFQWKNSLGTVNPKVETVTNSPSSKLTGTQSFRYHLQIPESKVQLADLYHSYRGRERWVPEAWTSRGSRSQGACFPDPPRWLGRDD